MITPSKTYKFYSPNFAESAIYFTIAGEKTQTALFINSREMKSFQWISALMTSYSRQIQSGTPLKNIVADMKETFDPKGSYLIPDGSGREVNSIVHHLGLILEKHNISLKEK